jgi:hypothetical protein
MPPAAAAAAARWHYMEEQLTMLETMLEVRKNRIWISWYSLFPNLIGQPETPQGLGRRLS